MQSEGYRASLKFHRFDGSFSHTAIEFPGLFGTGLRILVTYLDQITALDEPPSLKHICAFSVGTAQFRDKIVSAIRRRNRHIGLTTVDCNDIFGTVVIEVYRYGAFVIFIGRTAVPDAPLDEHIPVIVGFSPVPAGNQLT